MSLERIVIRVLIFAFSLTLISLVFYEVFHSTSENDYAKLASNNKKIALLNETLSLLKEDLQRVYKDHITLIAPVELIADVPHLAGNVTDGDNRKEAKSFTSTTMGVMSNMISTELSQRPKKRALLYTMDSISSYELASKHGGAAGELLIRYSLTNIFKDLNIYLDVKDTDEEDFHHPIMNSIFHIPGFESADTSSYDIIIVDPWTWAAKGWVPKKHLIGMDHKIYVLDFFGSKKLRGMGLNVPINRFLTAYRTNLYNSFLGYYIEEDNVNNLNQSDVREYVNKYEEKKNQGILWGKDIKHFDGKIEIIKLIAKKTLLLSTSSDKMIFDNSNVIWLGHQNKKEWLHLLSQSKFLIGLGDPLLGPSAIDAISNGCMYINPIYEKSRKVNDQIFLSQHSYAVNYIGEPYVCSYKINDITSLQDCIDKALKTNLKPFVPEDFTKDAYRQRVIHIFNL